VQRETLKTGEDVDAILRIALRQEHGSADELRDRLNRSADELGISPDALAKAEALYLAEGEKIEQERNAETKLKKFMKAKMEGFKAHLYTYLSVNFMVTVIWALSSRHSSWIGYVWAGWGIAILLHLVFAKHPATISEPDFQKWLALGEPARFSKDDSVEKSGVGVVVHVADRQNE
jgi:hypothetical protein